MVKPLSKEYVKTCFSDKREQSETRVHLQSLEQKMLSSKEWFAFFHKIKNKQLLLNLLVTYLCADDFVQGSPLSILVKNKNEIFIIWSNVAKVFECNHKVVDTRMIFHALQQKINVAVCSKDAEVFVLMVVAYALNRINEKLW